MTHLFIHRFDPRNTPFPLGRHIEKDSRSRAFTFSAPVGGYAKVTKVWEHSTPVLDQGTKSSCTGNAMAQMLNCHYFTPCREGKLFLAEPDAVKLYSLATHLDGFGPDQYYPPNDNGSTGLGVAKAAHQLGYISSYRHCFTMAQLQDAIQTQPVIVGTAWTRPMFTPDPVTGFVVPGPLNDSTVQGGHEYLCQGIDYERQCLVFLNSWGTSWGGGEGLTPGQFRISLDDFATLLADDGDIVVPVGNFPKPHFGETGITQTT